MKSRTVCWTSGCVGVHRCTWRKEVDTGVFHYCCLPCFLRQCPSLNPEFTDWIDWQAGVLWDLPVSMPPPVVGVTSLHGFKVEKKSHMTKCSEHCPEHMGHLLGAGDRHLQRGHPWGGNIWAEKMTKESKRRRDFQAWGVVFLKEIF